MNKRSCCFLVHTLIVLGKDAHGLWWCRHMLCSVGNFVLCVCENVVVLVGMSLSMDRSCRSYV